MDVLGDLVARQRRSDDPALVAPVENRRYDYYRFCTTAWKTGNFWRRRGVHEGATVAVADDPVPEAIFAFLGAALLGARTEFGLPDSAGEGPGAGEEAQLDARIAVAPHDEVGEYDLAPGSQRVAYGGPPDDPAVAHFERDVWSENPAFPETAIDPGTVALVAGGEFPGDERKFSHADLLSAARDVADDGELEPDDEVAVRASLAEPGTIVAGVVAPLLAGAAILFPDEQATDEVATGDFAVADGSEDVPENQIVRPSDAV
jgi:hypothetical protein